MSLPRIAFGWHPGAVRKHNLPGYGPESPKHGREALAALGNMGFAVIGEAARGMIACDERASGFIDLRWLAPNEQPDQLADRLNRAFDALLLPMAYDIGGDAPLGPVADVIEALNIPVITLCLGLNVPPETPLSRLSPDLATFLNVLNKKAAVFGVRGMMTEEWLHRHGYKRAQALGCPSLHTNPKAIRDLSCPDLARPVASGGYLLRDRARGEALSRLFARVEAHYVMQDEILAPGVLDQDAKLTIDDDPEISANVVRAACARLCGFTPAFASYRLFLNIPPWRRALAGQMAFIGDRFHGAAVALQAGLPVVLFEKDVRARDLALFYSIPTLDLFEAAHMGAIAALEAALTPAALVAQKTTFERRHASLRHALAQAGFALSAAP